MGKVKNLNFWGKSMEREAAGLKLSLGEKIPYFSLTGTDGRIHSVADFQTAKALVVVFTCNHCPYAQAYEQRLIELANRYQPLGVQFVAICSNDAGMYPEDSFENMVAKSKTLGLPFPYLHDTTQAAAKGFDAACTPEAFLFDGHQQLCYHGRIDDNYRDPSQVEQRDLQNAIEAILAGGKPKPALTPCIGCSIKWKRG